MIEKATVFTNGESQAVRLPKDCQYNEDEVLVNRIGSITVITPKDNKWDGMLRSIEMFTDDFMANGRSDLPAEKRKAL